MNYDRCVGDFEMQGFCGGYPLYIQRATSPDRMIIRSKDGTWWCTRYPFSLGPCIDAPRSYARSPSREYVEGDWPTYGPANCTEY